MAPAHERCPQKTSKIAGYINRRHTLSKSTAPVRPRFKPGGGGGDRQLPGGAGPPLLGPPFRHRAPPPAGSGALPRPPRSPGWPAPAGVGRRRGAQAGALSPPLAGCAPPSGAGAVLTPTRTASVSTSVSSSQWVITCVSAVALSALHLCPLGS